MSGLHFNRPRYGLRAGPLLRLRRLGLGFLVVVYHHRHPVGRVGQQVREGLVSLPLSDLLAFWELSQVDQLSY